MWPIVVLTVVVAVLISLGLFLSYKDLKASTVAKNGDADPLPVRQSSVNEESLLKSYRSHRGLARGSNDYRLDTSESIRKVLESVSNEQLEETQVRTWTEHVRIQHKP